MRGFEVKTGEMPQARSSGPGISPVLVFFNPLTLFSQKNGLGTQHLGLYCHLVPFCHSSPSWI
jgi:hypothetical protein